MTAQVRRRSGRRECPRVRGYRRPARPQIRMEPRRRIIFAGAVFDPINSRRIRARFK